MESVATEVARLRREHKPAAAVRVIAIRTVQYADKGQIENGFLELSCGHDQYWSVTPTYRGGLVVCIHEDHK